MLMKYKNYIFDFYGTLVDIKTDENQKALWDHMRDMYACYGADYTSEQLRDSYHYLCKAEALKFKNKMHVEHVEIDIGAVFVRLLLEAPKRHKSEYEPNAWSHEDVERWSFHTAIMFRTLSRQYCYPYKNTLSTLNVLKKEGCRLFLVSNAQRYFTIPEIEQCGLKELFDAIYISSDYKVKKPDVQFLNQVFLDHHMKKSSSVYIGNDFESDIQCAMDTGIDSVFLNTDHLDLKERKKRMKKLRMNEDHSPVIITSGDIREILEV